MSTTEAIRGQQGPEPTFVGQPDGPTRMRRTTAWLAATGIAVALVAVPIGMSKAEFEQPVATTVERSTDTFYVIYLADGWAQTDPPAGAPADSTAYSRDGVTLFAESLPDATDAQAAAQKLLEDHFPEQAKDQAYVNLTGSKGVIYRVENTAEPTFVYAISVDKGLVVGYSSGVPKDGDVANTAEEIFASIGSIQS